VKSALHTKVLLQKHSVARSRDGENVALLTPEPMARLCVASSNVRGGFFPNIGSTGNEHGPLPRRHSGKGSAVPERCPSISVFFAPFGADSLEAGNRFASRASSHLTAECAVICSDRLAAYDPAIRTLAFDRSINPID